MDNRKPNSHHHPSWLKVRLTRGTSFVALQNVIKHYHLHTVCQSARCPNIGECWSKRSLTFMILGDICSRNCHFCAVKAGRPLEFDASEPERVAKAVMELKLRYAVITSVTRDDLEDGGAEAFAETVRKIKEYNPKCKIETLIPDFQGSESALRKVVDSGPDVLSHNVETVPRLYPTVRPQAQYQRSLHLLQRAKEWGAKTKTGLMLGLGEQWQEILEVMSDVRAVYCDILTLGQYLQPTKEALPVRRFYTPEEFALLKINGAEMRFQHVQSGPLVRSSYHAEEQVAAGGLRRR